MVGCGEIWRGGLQGIEPEKECEGEDHQFRDEQDEDACVVEAPLAREAAGGFKHAPKGSEDGENLPGRGLERVCAGEAFEAETGGE